MKSDTELLEPLTEFYPRRLSAVREVEGDDQTPKNYGNLYQEPILDFVQSIGHVRSGEQEEEELTSSSTTGAISESEFKVLTGYRQGMAKRFQNAAPYYNSSTTYGNTDASVAINNCLQIDIPSLVEHRAGHDYYLLEDPHRAPGRRKEEYTTTTMLCGGVIVRTPTTMQYTTTSSNRIRRVTVATRTMVICNGKEEDKSPRPHSPSTTSSPQTETNSKGPAPSSPHQPNPEADAFVQCDDVSVDRTNDVNPTLRRSDEQTTSNSKDQSDSPSAKILCKGENPLLLERNNTQNVKPQYA
ncbi:unnamed protein product [Cyprideis torosa]|uniref:Uncharacterized protein n=1 Tax=Cyprideis torosa TaxID=163714 RepID=A0A7R8WIK8_9CRUS|nr:unnamed protein product [Cyprideis torosa]CAG0900900.1 unnamed protein product [Cyprideis torosa]